MQNNDDLEARAARDIMFAAAASRARIKGVDVFREACTYFRVRVYDSLSAYAKAKAPRCRRSSRSWLAATQCWQALSAALNLSGRENLHLSTVASRYACEAVPRVKGYT